MIEMLEQTRVINSHTTPQDSSKSFASDVLSGLTDNPKRLSSVFFYDEQGSQLFEQICDLDEYYLTRKETEILNRFAEDIIKALPSNTRLIELGSGSSTKTRILLEAALSQFGKTRYSPIDVSSTMLTDSANKLAQRYPQLQIEAFAGRYESGLEHFLKHSPSPDCIMWLGSSIGNLTRDEATQFLREIHQNAKVEDRLLLGIDLRKDTSVLEPAYNDSKRITADFNINLLRRINTELGGNFKISQFQHHAVYNQSEGRIEMYLISIVRQSVWIDALGTTISFGEGEVILTEYSYKYSPAEIAMLARSSGFRLEHQWLDQQGYFSLSLLSPRTNNS